jgi:hypothetical protein
MEAVASNRPVLDILMQVPEVASTFKREDIEQAILPEKHIGMAKELSSRTIAFVQDRMQVLGKSASQREQHCSLCTEGEASC